MLLFLVSLEGNVYVPLCHSFPLTLSPCSSVCPSLWLESFTEISSPMATAPARNLLQHGAASFRPWLPGGWQSVVPEWCLPQHSPLHGCSEIPVSSLPSFWHLANSSYEILNQCVPSLQVLFFPVSMAWGEKDHSRSISLQPAFALLRGGPKNFPPHFIQCRENSSGTCFMEHTKWKQITMAALSRKNEQSYRYHVLSHMSPVPVWQFSGFQHMSFICTNQLQETCPADWNHLEEVLFILEKKRILYVVTK